MGSRFDDFREEDMKAQQARSSFHSDEDRFNHDCVKYFDLQYRKYWALLHHSPNEGKRSEKEGMNQKLKGMRPGFPDLILLMPIMQHRFLAIELKAKRGSQINSEKRWEEEATKNGGFYVVIKSYEKFIKLIDDWIKKAELWQKVIEGVFLHGQKLSDGKEISQLLEIKKEDYDDRRCIKSAGLAGCRKSNRQNKTVRGNNTDKRKGKK